MITVRNHAPSPDLAPFIRQHYVFEANLPADFALVDRLYADHAFVRFILTGQFTAIDAQGAQNQLSGGYVLGSNLHGFGVRLQGPFRTIGFAVRPCAWRALFACEPSQLVDKAMPLAQDWGDAATALSDALSSAHDDDAVIVALEKTIRARLASVGHNRIDERIALFEQIMRTNSTARVDAVAARLGLSARQLERRCLSSFGLSPKMILRRSRFLDMAAAMKGFGHTNEAELATLRFYDQSHRNREFRKFIGMTPGQFVKANAPLLAVTLSFREQGKSMI